MLYLLTLLTLIVYIGIGTIVVNQDEGMITEESFLWRTFAIFLWPILTICYIFGVFKK